MTTQPNHGATPISPIAAQASVLRHNVEPTTPIGTERERYVCTNCQRTISLGADWEVYGPAFDERCD